MAKLKDLEFRELGEAERKLLLKALDISTENMHCYYCKDKVDYKSCSILPPLKKGEIGRITCGSPLCLCEFMEDYEDS